MMYLWQFKGCLRCGCELESGTGLCLMCGQPLNHRRSWLRAIAQALEGQIEGPCGPVPSRDDKVLSDPHLSA